MSFMDPRVEVSCCGRKVPTIRPASSADAAANEPKTDGIRRNDIDWDRAIGPRSASAGVVALLITSGMEANRSTAHAYRHAWTTRRNECRLGPIESSNRTRRRALCASACWYRVCRHRARRPNRWKLSSRCRGAAATSRRSGERPSRGWTNWFVQKSSVSAENKAERYGSIG